MARCSSRTIRGVVDQRRSVENVDAAIDTKTECRGHLGGGHRQRSEKLRLRHCTVAITAIGRSAVGIFDRQIGGHGGQRGGVDLLTAVEQRPG